MILAAPTAGSDAQLVADRGHIAVAVVDGAFDVLVGDGSAETNVHAISDLSFTEGSDSK